MILIFAAASYSSFILNAVFSVALASLPNPDSLYAIWLIMREREREQIIELEKEKELFYFLFLIIKKKNKLH